MTCRNCPNLLWYDGAFCMFKAHLSFEEDLDEECNIKVNGNPGWMKAEYEETDRIEEL